MVRLETGDEMELRPVRRVARFGSNPRDPQLGNPTSKRPQAPVSAVLGVQRSWALTSAREGVALPSALPGDSGYAGYTEWVARAGIGCKRMFGLDLRERRELELPGGRDAACISKNSGGFDSAKVVLGGPPAWRLGRSVEQVR